MHGFEAVRKQSLTLKKHLGFIRNIFAMVSIRLRIDANFSVFDSNVGRHLFSLTRSALLHSKEMIFEI